MEVPVQSKMGGLSSFRRTRVSLHVVLFSIGDLLEVGDLLNSVFVFTREDDRRSTEKVANI